MHFIERPRGGEQAVLVHLDLYDKEAQEDLGEFCELARSAGVCSVSIVTGTRKVPDSKYFVGLGKAEEIRTQVELHNANIVLFNHSLSPAQERNLEQLLRCRVLDRTGLILDIFAQRASSYEGKLQVELAQLRHLSTRLVRGWSHLERQKGGIGLRGPGESQLETDRRLIKNRIHQLNKRLEKVRRQRGERRRGRAGTPTISLVGYTNAGKSTLFNTLTGAGVYAVNQLFATLDPTLRRLDLAGNQSVVLADTVGFIRHLPHNLVAAFRSTLEESQHASLLLHVIDVREHERMERIAQVNVVLGEIGAGEVPQIQVFNKIDLFQNHAPRLDRGQDGHIQRVWLSAATGKGMELLRQAVAEHVLRLQGMGMAEKVRKQLQLAPNCGRLRAQLHERGAVLSEKPDALGGWCMDIEVWSDEAQALANAEGCTLEEIYA